MTGFQNGIKNEFLLMLRGWKIMHPRWIDGGKLSMKTKGSFKMVREKNGIHSVWKSKLIIEKIDKFRILKFPELNSPIGK